MKKVLISTMVLLFTSCLLAAPTTTVSLEVGKNKLTNEYYDQLKVDAAYSKNKFAIGLDMSAAQTRDNNVLTAAAEAYGTYNIAKRPWGLSSYLTLTLGEQFATGNNYAYYTVKPTLKHKLYKAFNWSASYEYRSAFESSVVDESNKYQLGVDTVFKGHTFGLAPFITRGTSRTAGLELSVSL